MWAVRMWRRTCAMISGETGRLQSTPDTSAPKDEDELEFEFGWTFMGVMVSVSLWIGDDGGV